MLGGPALGLKMVAIGVEMLSEVRRLVVGDTVFGNSHYLRFD